MVEDMEETKTQPVVTVADEELHWSINVVRQVPYLALPRERPQIICFAGSVKELSGYDANEILADRQLWINMVHPADRERVFAVLSYCRNSGMPFEIEYHIINKDGLLHRVIDEGEPVYDDKGQVTGVEGIITDVSNCGKVKDIDLSRIRKVTSPNNVNSSVFQKS